MEHCFTNRQLDVMNILWGRGSATVREAKERLDDDLAYTSVLTVFQTLEKNGHVRHESEGRAYCYYPTVSRKEAGREAVGYLLRRVFEDSPSQLLNTLVEIEDVSDRAEEEILTSVH